MEKKKAKDKKEEVKAYIGPSIQAYGLSTGTTFIGDYPGNIKDAVEKYKGIDSLFVKVDKNYAICKKNIKIKGTRENLIYKKIEKKIKEEDR